MNVNKVISDIINISPGAGVVLDPAGNILYSNPVFHQILVDGITDVSEPKNFDSLLCRAASFGKNIGWKDLLKQIDTTEVFELNVNLLNNAERVYACHASRLGDSDEKYVLIFFNDITIQWQLEKKMALRSSAVDRIISEFPSIICGIDHDGIIRVWNHRASEITGYTANDMIDNPKAMSLLFPNQRYRYEIMEKWNSREENVIRNWDMEVTCKDGNMRIISWTVRYRENPIIEDINHWAVGLDVTSEVIAMRALKMSEEKFRLISKSTNDALWDYDLLEGTLWWSEGMTESFGYKSSEIEQTLIWWEEKIHPDYREIVAKRFGDFIGEGGHFWTDEYLFRKKDNTYAYVVDRGYILRDSKGNQVRAIGGMTDLTNEKSMEELAELREAQFNDLVKNNSNRVKSPLSKVMQISKLLSIIRHERHEVKDLIDQLLRSAHDLEVAIGSDDDDEDELD